MKSNARNTTVVCGVRNRNTILEKSLENWLSFPLNEVIIVDFRDDSCERAWEIVEKTNDDRIRLIETGYEYAYNYSLALNLAMAHASMPYVVKFDVDYHIHDVFFDRNSIDEKTMIGGFDQDFWWGKLLGIAYVPLRLFHKINGYHEGLIGYGCEDEDFFFRASQHVQTKLFDPETLYHKPHDDRIRINALSRIPETIGAEDLRIIRESMAALNYEILEKSPWTEQSKRAEWKLTELGKNHYFAVR